MYKVSAAILIHAGLTSYGLSFIGHYAAGAILGIVAGAIGVILFLAGIGADYMKAAS